MRSPRLRRRSRIPREVAATPIWWIPLGLVLLAGVVASLIVLFTTDENGSGAPFMLIACGVGTLIVFIRLLPARRQPDPDSPEGTPEHSRYLRHRHFALWRRIGVFVGGYVVLLLMFWTQWRDWTVFKGGVALAIFVGGTFAFDLLRLDRPYDESGRTPRGGSHTQRQAREWPPWRREAMVFTGLLLVLAGLFQTNMVNGIAGGICTTFLCGLGAAMLGVAATLGRVRRPGHMRKRAKLSDIFE